MTLEYRDVSGFDGYRVGSDGSVWSRKVSCWGGNRTVDGWVKVGSPMSCGYISVTLRKDGKRTVRLAHHLVLEAFIGPCPDGMEGCHRNGVRHDNRVENLRWDTHRDNILDRVRNGTMVCGENVWTAKLSEDDVLEILQMAAQGKTRREMADKFMVGKTTVTNIVLGISWKHVQRGVAV